MLSLLSTQHMHRTSSMHAVIIKRVYGQVHTSGRSCATGTAHAASNRPPHPVQVMRGILCMRCIREQHAIASQRREAAGMNHGACRSVHDQQPACCTTCCTTPQRRLHTVVLKPCSAVSSPPPWPSDAPLPSCRPNLCVCSTYHQQQQEAIDRQRHSYTVILSKE